MAEDQKSDAGPKPAPIAPAAPSGEPMPTALPVTTVLAGAIDQWFGESFHGTRLGHDTELYNLVFRAKDDLKKRLAQILKEA